MSGDTFSWNGGSGSFADPAMWTDLTDPANTGTLAPGGNDTAIFSTDGDVSDGDSDVDALQIEATVSFAGEVVATALTVDAMDMLTASAGFSLSGVTIDGTLIANATGYLTSGTIAAGGSIAINGSSPPDFGVRGSLGVAGAISGAYRLLDSGDVEVSGSQATLSTQAPGSGFSLAGDIIVGVAGHPQATIDVSNGGSVVSDNVYIGVQDEAGLAIVDAAQWRNSGFVTVGDDQQGTLWVKHAGTMDATQLDINAGAGPGGAATIEDAGSVLLATSGLFVGPGGTLLVTSKAFLDSSGTFNEIGIVVQNPGATTDPQAVVSNGGTWHGGTIDLGPGTIAVQAGTFTAASLTIGPLAGHGGVVQGTGGGTLGIAGNLVVGASAAATGTVTLDGAMTTLSVGGTTEIGKAGTGTLALGDGAMASLAVLIVAAAATSGSDAMPDAVTVDGSGSTLAVSGDASIDGASILATNSFGLANGTFGNWSYGPSGVGALTAANGGIVAIGGTLTLQAPNDPGAPAAVNVTAGGGIVVGATTGAMADTLVVAAGGLVTGHGTIAVDATAGSAPAGEVLADGTVEATLGTLELNANVGGGGVFTIDMNATLKIDGSVDAGTMIGFNALPAGPAATNYSTTLALEDPQDFAGTIENFAQGDTIYLPNYQPSGALIGVTSFADGLSIQGVGTVELTGADPVPAIGLKPDTNGGTDVETVSLQTLLDLAMNTYNAPFAGADGYSEIAVAPADSGFEAVAYKDNNPDDGDPSVVVAFRGTSMSSIPAFVKNIVADSSFLLGLPNGLLFRYIGDAAKFLAQVASGYPTAQIMLTGHSLGGGIAQLLGEASGFGTAAFNAPGTGQLYSTLAGQLAAANNLGDGGSNINYRVTGDQVSFAGTPMRQTYSLPSVKGTDGTTNPAIALLDALYNHMNFPNLASSAYTEGFTDPDDVSLIQSLLQSPAGLRLHIVLQVVAGVLTVIDPAQGSTFVLAADAGSPDISAIVLPALAGVSSYDVAYQTGTVTSAFSVVLPGATDDLPAGVNAVTFDPLDAGNLPTVVPSSFFLGIACARSGTFTGTLTESGGTPYPGPVTGADAVTLQPGAAAAALGIPAPTDPSDANPADFGVLVTGLPDDATVTLAGGVTPVMLDQALTAAQLGGLEVAPDAGAARVSSTFSYTVTDASFASVDGTATIDVACFVAGTRVLTAAGEVAVERLRPGMRVVSVRHRTLLPVVWTGHRKLRAARPVRVCAGAFGAGVPHRFLLLSPDHAVFVDGVLVPVRHLVNGVTIVEEHHDEVLYYHVELARHGVLLAEGLPAESYLDTGNRAGFANFGTARGHETLSALADRAR